MFTLLPTGSIDLVNLDYGYRCVNTINYRLIYYYNLYK